MANIRSHPQLLPVERRKTIEEELFSFIDEINEILLIMKDDKTATQGEIRGLCNHYRLTLQNSHKEHLINYFNGLETSIRNLLGNGFTKHNFELNIFLGWQGYLKMAQKKEYMYMLENYIHG